MGLDFDMEESQSTGDADSEDGLDDFTVSLDEDDDSLDMELEASLPSPDEQIDDLSALAKDLADLEEDDEKDFSFEKGNCEDITPQSENTATETLSSQLLMRIADELSSIKEELSALKSELTVLKTSEIKEADSALTEEGGILAIEEEDEKIALTGDELNNILNSADFTEEDGTSVLSLEEEDSSDLEEEVLGFEADDISMEISEDESESEDDLTSLTSGDLDISMDDAVGTEQSEEDPAFLSDLPDLLDEDDDIELDISMDEEDEEIVDELDLSESFSLEQEEDADEDLMRLAEEGIEPMTSPPDDVDYLESELDLSEAVIEEPDFGDITLEEIEIEEPSLDTDLLEDSFEEILPENFSPEEAVEAEDDLEIEELGELDKADEENAFSPKLQSEVKAVLAYMDQLLESLPEEKIEEFARSEYFETYKKLFEELGLA